MVDPQAVRDTFAGFPFGTPCASAEIAEAEKRLGHALPAVLRGLYSAFDGFTGPTNAPFLYPLTRAPRASATTLVDFTLFLRTEGYFPTFVHRAVAVGDDGGGASWMVRLGAPHTVIRWGADWGQGNENQGGPLRAAWREAKRLYESLGSRE